MNKHFSHCHLLSLQMHVSYVAQFGFLNAAQLITCRPGCVSVRGQSSQVKGQGAANEMSRIMDMPAVTRCSAHQITERARATPGKMRQSERKRRGGYRQNEWRVFKGKIRDVFALLNGLEKRRNLLRWRQKCFLRRELAVKGKREKKQSGGRKRGTDKIKKRGELEGRVMWKGEERGMSVLTVDGR